MPGDNNRKHAKPPLPVVGRSADWNPRNRFERIHLEPEWDHLDDVEPDASTLARKVPTEYYLDDSQSVVSSNNSPDVSFQFSINPYRGCVHGCSYCYARPYHEYLGLSAGLDFESKIFVKPDAPRLFRKWLSRKSWQCEPVNLSGVTDPYQPCERKFRVTRGCLQVARECGQPVYVITKNAMIRQDLDLLGELAAQHLTAVIISITTLQPGLARMMEPGTSTPEARLSAIRALSERGIPVAVNVAPIIFGLTDHEVPEILKRSADAGATYARYTVLRLPGPVEPLFIDWVEQHYPDRQERIQNGIRAMREGQLSSSVFHDRMQGTGTIAKQIRSMFRLFARTHGLDRKPAPLDCQQFQRPTGDPTQKSLF